jgi:hypothetical protein
MPGPGWTRPSTPARAELVVGAMKEKALMPFATLYSHFVDVGTSG